MVSSFQSRLNMRQKVHFTAIILAAGASSRMGEPKQILKVSGRCMLDHSILAAVNASIDPPIVVLGANAELIESRATQLSRCTVVKNDNFHLGLSTSLIRGIQAAPPLTDAYIFILADQPMVKSNLLLEMMEEFTKTRADVLYPEFQGQRGNPVIVASRLHDRLLLARGDSGARHLIADSSLKIVPYRVTTSAVITDIDTPEDFQKICKANSSAALRHTAAR